MNSAVEITIDIPEYTMPMIHIVHNILKRHNINDSSFQYNNMYIYKKEKEGSLIGPLTINNTRRLVSYVSCDKVQYSFNDHEHYCFIVYGCFA